MSSTEKNWMRRALRLSDYVILAAVVCAGIGSSLWTYMKFRRPDRIRTAIIQIDADTILSLHLSGEGRKESFELALPRGRGMLETDGTRIRVLPMPDSVCPLHVCSRTGWIDRPGQLIACVPNRLVITVRGSEYPVADSLDGITP